MATIQIELPDEVLNLPDQSEETLRTLAREALLVRLYDQGIVTTGWAAQALGISRHEFLDMLGRYGVSEFDEQMHVGAEAEHVPSERYHSVQAGGIWAGVTITDEDIAEVRRAMQHSLGEDTL